jgi:hypothetical protein
MVNLPSSVEFFVRADRELPKNVYYPALGRGSRQPRDKLIPLVTPRERRIVEFC